ncbi:MULTISPECIES: histidine phosphatase family protein [Clostridium]|uniref:Histidine phosphatase family protein n=1 Tax=Clostridium aquiflavi TaxID=3073603 RepID=A0ABU1EHW2_9CLOT|nr:MULTISPECIES: histidine phosphatase family protein [unclassified Clostridium]MDR5587982.1 histidine phosphatase family protein [Clostridium sp. 5N-1]NFG61761.1 phosphoglycerate mutase family protein [Clostridium botulinum]NFQ08546.1 phosphoglycerate mutase family protein [Clostridium botulinum]
MSKIELYLIRHGKTYCNKEKLYYGKTDVSLCDEGIIDLIDKKKNYIYPLCEKYFTSGLKRANETFEILYPNEEYYLVPELCEYNFGEFELKSYEDLKENPKYQEWIMDEVGEVKCPNGESKKEFKERILKGFFNLICELSNENIKSALAVLHGGTIGMLLEELYDNKKSFIEWQPQGGDGYKLIISLENDVEITSVKEIFKM